MSEENDLFGFDFDDDDFVTKEKETVAVSEVEYEAKEETDGWFHNFDKSFEELMLEQHGPNQLRSAIEYDYFYKKYDQALEQALQFIHIVKNNKKCKMTSTREISEIAMHCAAKLGKLDVLDELLSSNQSQAQDIGLYLVQAKFYPLVGRYHEAMNVCITYQKERKLDYRIWSIMADVFLKSAEKKSASNDMRYHLANLSMQRAIHIFICCRWKKNIECVKARFDRDLAQLQARLEETKKHDGDADKFVEWMTAGSADKDQTGLDEFSWDDIMWIYKDWVIRQDIDLESDTKAVKDM